MKPMIYILFIIGVIICIYGWRLIKTEKRVKGETFRDFISEQNNENGEYIKLLSLNIELKNQLNTIEDNLNILLKKTKETENLYKEDTSHPNYNEAANKIEKMTKEKKSVEEMASELGMGKGEVLLLKRLLTK